MWPRDVAKVKVTATWHSAIPPTVPEYWRAAPTGGGGLLIGGLVHHQYRGPVIEPRNRPGRCRIQDLLVIPGRPGQQMLQPVRATVPGRLGDAPAVAVLQLHQQPVHHLTGGLAGLPPRKTPRHLPEQVLQQDARLVIR